MTNNIFLHGLKLATKIGVPDWERAVSQQLIIDVDIQLKGNQIFDSNDISHLLEDFGEDIISCLKEKFHFEKIILKISKQKILHDTDFVGIILER